MTMIMAMMMPTHETYHHYPNTMSSYCHSHDDDDLMLLKELLLKVMIIKQKYSEIGNLCIILSIFVIIFFLSSSYHL